VDLSNQNETRLTTIYQKKASNQINQKLTFESFANSAVLNDLAAMFVGHKSASHKWIFSMPLWDALARQETRRRIKVYKSQCDSHYRE